MQRICIYSAISATTPEPAPRCLHAISMIFGADEQTQTRWCLSYIASNNLNRVT